MYTNQQIQDAKSRLKITQYLASKGIQPAAMVAGQFVYLSPFRTENTPSFWVDPRLNVFNDFADEGGDIIRLVRRLENLSFPNAVKFLSEFDGVYEIEMKELDTPRNPQKNHLIKYVGNFKSKALVNYATLERGIPLKVLVANCQEVQYSTEHGSFYGIAFKNESGGYELRNPKFKGVLGHKDISIRGNINSPFVYVFEGFFDFLTYIAQKGKLNCCFVILNSLALATDKLITQLHENYDYIGLYLDNDTAGQTRAAALVAKFSKVHSHLNEYEGYKDLNEKHALNKLAKYNGK